MLVLGLISGYDPKAGGTQGTEANPLARKVPDQWIECRSLHGGYQSFPASEIRFRPAAYGFAVQNGKVLLGRSVFTGRLEPPGGAVEPWENIETGLRREFWEETGVYPEPLRLVHFTSNFFSMFNRPFNSLRFYFLVKVPEGATLKPQVREVSEVSWIPIQELPWDELGSDDAVALKKALAERDGSG